MAPQSKLKAALVAEKGVDFKKQHQKKMAKKARKAAKTKKPADDWEDVEEDSDNEDAGGVDLEEGNEEGSGDEAPAPVSCAN
jgi:rRNA-processing protein EBP2